MAHHTITASELKFAVLDADWRRKWLAGEKPSTRSFAPPGTPRAMGVRFHKEAEALVAWLTSKDNLAAAAKITTPDILVDHIWATSLQAATDRLIEAGRIEDAVVFVERIRSFCARIIDLRRRTRKFENWQDVFIAAEESLARAPIRVGETWVDIRGRVDAIRFHPEKQFEVVDYKLSQGTEPKADLVQLAIYAHLLSVLRPGCQFCGTLEYYLPDLKEFVVSPEELNDIFSGLVAPVLREMFAARTSGSLAENGASETERKQAALGGKVVAAYQGFNLAVAVAGVVQGPQLIRIRLTPGPGVKVSSLTNRADDLQVKLSLAEAPLIRAGRGFVMLDLPRPDPTPCRLETQMSGALGGALAGIVSFPIGIGVEGEPIVAELSDPNTCHALVAGSTGSGKSEWLKTMVASLTLRNTPNQIRVALIDPKILTFTGVEGSPYLWKPLATSLDEAMQILRAAVAELDTRYEVLARGGFANLSERVKAGKTDLPFLVLIFDEFADLVLAGRDERREFETLVARIAGKGRAAGIHLVLATQRPDRAIVTGLIKANLPLKVCLKVANAVNSQIVLGEAGAERLFGKGDLLCDLGNGLVRAQGLLIPQSGFLGAMIRSGGQTIAESGR
jgi:S-DNA-T family DNA segregation ATPase FtsK/SpoIIIE